LDEGETMASGSEVVIPALMRVKEVARYVAMSPASVWRLVAKGEFPKPVKVGGATRWRTEQVVEWVQEQEAA
jgi:prophage regulatory protein